jgi:hypothetical protein
MARDFNAKNIIVGAAVVYVGKEGVENNLINVGSSSQSAQKPSNVTNVSGGNWYHLGYTMEGVTLNIEPTFNDVMVDQLLDTARLFKTSQRVTVATSLTEATLENLYVAIGGKAGGEGDYLTASAGASFNQIANADGSNTTSSATPGVSVGGTTASAQTQNVLHLNGGALGVSPVERSVCFVGSAPTSVAELGSVPAGQSTGSAERIYMLYRAVSVEAVGVGVRRDDSTVFPINFRVMPSTSYTAPDGNAAYGKIIDRVF